MKIFDFLKRLVTVLESSKNPWAICGGVAASLYRELPRFTDDIDIAIADLPNMPALNAASEVLTKLGYKPKAGFVTDQFGKLIKGQALLIGRDETPGSFTGVDFLLPIIPWVTQSVARAQHNMLDYGFAKVPTITPEDLIIAKLFAFQGTPERRMDLDDIVSVLEGTKVIDKDYLRKECEAAKLNLPEQVRRFLS